MRDLKADLEIISKATPGPWRYDGMHQEIQTPHEKDFWLIVSECRTTPDQEYQCDQFGHHYDNNFAFIAQAREGWPHAIERAIKAETEVERLRMALDKIANPLKYIQMEARAKGAELDGVYAIKLSKDPNYLKEIALAELDKDGENWRWSNERKADLIQRTDGEGDIGQAKDCDKACR